MPDEVISGYDVAIFFMIVEPGPYSTKNKSSQITEKRQKKKTYSMVENYDSILETRKKMYEKF